SIRNCRPIGLTFHPAPVLPMILWEELSPLPWYALFNLVIRCAFEIAVDVFRHLAAEVAFTPRIAIATEAAEIVGGEAIAFSVPVPAWWWIIRRRHRLVLRRRRGQHFIERWRSHARLCNSDCWRGRSFGAARGRDRSLGLRRWFGRAWIRRWDLDRGIDFDRRVGLDVALTIAHLGHQRKIDPPFRYVEHAALERFAISLVGIGLGDDLVVHMQHALEADGVELQQRVREQIAAGC